MRHDGAMHLSNVFGWSWELQMSLM